MTRLIIIFLSIHAYLQNSHFSRLSRSALLNDRNQSTMWRISKTLNTCHLNVTHIEQETENKLCCILILFYLVIFLHKNVVKTRKRDRLKICQVTYLPSQEIDRPTGHLAVDSDVTYCVCRQPDDGFMIECDWCDEWFHGRCVNVSEEEGVRIKKYKCPNYCKT